MLLAVRPRLGVDDNPDQKTHDFGPLLIVEAGIKALAKARQDVVGVRAERFILLPNQRRETAPNVGQFGVDAGYLGSDVGLRKDACHGQMHRSSAVGAEGIHALGEKTLMRDDLGAVIGPVRGAIKLGEDVAWVAQPALDVGPDGWVEHIRPYRLARAPAGQRASLMELAVAAVPAEICPTASARVRQAIDATADHAPEEVATAGGARDRLVAPHGLLGEMPELRRDEGGDLGRDDLVATPQAVLRALVNPPPELLLAAVDGVDEHVADATGAPGPLGPLLAFTAFDQSAVTGVMGGDAQGIQLGGDLRAAPALNAGPVIHLAHNVRGTEIGGEGPCVGRQTGRLLAPRDDIAERHDPAAIASLAGRAMKPFGAVLEELAPRLGGDGGVDVVDELIGLTFDHADHADVQFIEDLAGSGKVCCSTAEPIDAVHPDLIELARSGCRQESGASWSLGER